MLKTFKALLKGSRLEWIEDRPEQGEKMLEVYVTFLADEKIVNDSKVRGKKMAKILENIAATEELWDVEPVLWQQEIRQDGSLPGR